MHFFWQTTYVMVTFNHFTRDIERLYSIRINRALRKPFGISNLASFIVEYLYKIPANNLALFLRLGYPCQIREETFAGIYANHVQTEAFIIAHHIFKLILTEHTMIYENAGELLTDSLVEQYGHHRRIHTSGKAENHAVRANLLAELSYGSLHKRICAPLLLAAAHIHHKVFQEQGALKRMKHLRMKLCTKHRLLPGDIICCILYRLSRSYHMCAFGNTRDTVAVRHPYL